MYNIYNKSNIFYCYNHQYQRYTLIGNRDDFIAYIAKDIKDTYFSDSSRWIYSILDEQNLTMKDIRKEFYYVSHDAPVRQNICLRNLTFYDGYYRIVNVEDFSYEVIKFIKENKSVKVKTYKSNYTSRHYHSGNHERHKFPRVSRIMKYDLTPEMKPFIRVTKKRLPKYYDDVYRRVSTSWKDQNKDRKQWMHKIKAKDCDTIRKDFEKNIYSI